jgi:rare lipoprotein A
VRRAGSRWVAVLITLAGFLAMEFGCASGSVAASPRAPTKPGRPGAHQVLRGQVLRGKATYYADSLAGNKTASGDRYDPKALTGAHRRLPFGTRVRVTREDTGDSVEIVINDRGPFGGPGRIIDLSRAAAERLKMIRAGVVRVRVEVLR